MRKSWLMCALLGALAWGQAAPATPPPAPPQQQPAAPMAAGKPQAPAGVPDTAAAVPADAPVITVKGVCPAQPKPAAKTTAAHPASTAAKTPAADCKTVITKAEFERLASGIAPNLTPQMKRQLAGVIPRLIAMSAQAQKNGLDKTPRYLETVKFAKMQILTNELQRSIQDEAAKVPEADIADYYKKNPEAYEQYTLDRLFVPRFKQAETAEANDNDKDEKLTEEQQKAKEEQEKTKHAAAEEELSKLADSLRARAAAGEDFMSLQKEAFTAAGMKIETPTVNLPKLRRSGLPPGHAAVFDLKEGEVSQVISDAGGHYVYKVNKREQSPLDQVKDEIHNTLQNQRKSDAMDKLQNSFKAETNEAYFGPAVAQGPPVPPRGPGLARPKPLPSPMAPSAQPQGQAPAQPPAPASKPN